METVRWNSDSNNEFAGKLRLIEQTLLPEELKFIDLATAEEIYDAIKRLAVRGAPAIGCAAGLGLAAVCLRCEISDSNAFLEEAQKTADYLNSSRPTAVNLSWALRRCMKKLYENKSLPVHELKKLLLEEGKAILSEDIALCRSIGESGLPLFEGKPSQAVLTHCNAGELATGDYGTALAPIYLAAEKGLSPRVFADETRPLLQGARLTSWELQQSGIDVTLICDNMAAQVMKEGKIDLVIVGADRIAANGDAANKIGTYGVAVLAKYHNIPFYVAAPYSTFDAALDCGEKIPIEQRDPEEVRFGFGRRTAPETVNVYNPAFDVTPADLITAIITDKGIIKPPYTETIVELLNKSR